MERLTFIAETESGHGAVIDASKERGQRIVTGTPSGGRTC